MGNTVSGFLRKADIFGKYIDQPALIKSVYEKMPPVLIAGATAFGLYDTFNNKKVKQGEESRLERFVKNASILTGTVAFTLLFGKKFIHLPHVCQGGLKNMAERFKDDKTLSPLINKVREDKILGRKEVKTLYEGLEGLVEDGKKLIDKVIPTGHTHHKHEHGNGFFAKLFAKYPEFSEIKDLTVLGTIPVLGGIIGGVTGDILTGEKVSKTFPDKIKEGTYQYLANIVLCNAGAGAALLAVNRTKYKNSKPVKFFSMLAGILAVGVLGGSLIANFIGKKVINPLVDGHHQEKKHHKKQESFYEELYNERTPEAIDIGLHIDDVASAGFLSGLNIIAPILPVLYSISAYRAGIGYRNNKEKELPLDTKVRDLIPQNDVFYRFRKKALQYSHHH